jgi:O-acetyl-ADP-ribose deacetylase (regulator of RNase III)
MRLTSERKIKSMVFPGMGTGCGMVSPNSAAQQMALAWRHFTDMMMPITWPNVTARAYSINAAARAGMMR